MWNYDNVRRKLRRVNIGGKKEQNQVEVFYRGNYLSNDECTEHVKNKNKYMEIVMKIVQCLWSSEREEWYGSLLPNGLVQMLQDSDKFTEYGYAFLMGLYGCYGYVPKKGEQ